MSSSPLSQKQLIAQLLLQRAAVGNAAAQKLKEEKRPVFKPKESKDTELNDFEDELLNDLLIDEGLCSFYVQIIYRIQVKLHDSYLFLSNLFRIS